MPCQGCQRRKEKLTQMFRRTIGRMTPVDKNSLFIKLAKLKPPSEARRQRVLKMLHENKDKFSALHDRLPPVLQEAFRNSFDGEMGKLLDSKE